MISQDDEFSHEDGEGEFFGLTGGDESLVEMLENGVMSGGYESGHVEDSSDVGSATGDVSLAAELSAVVVEGCEAREGGCCWR